MVNNFLDPLRDGYSLECKPHPVDNVWANYNDETAEVTLSCGLVREVSPKSPKHSGLGIILICPDNVCDPVV